MEPILDPGYVGEVMYWNVDISKERERPGYDSDLSFGHSLR